MFSTTSSRKILLQFLLDFPLILAVITLFLNPSEAFSVPWLLAKADSKRAYLIRDSHWRKWEHKLPSLSQLNLVLHVSTIRKQDVVANDKNEENDSERELLRQTKKSEFVSLCERFEISAKGNKLELLKRLQNHADSKIKEERQRLDERKKRIEDGSGQNDREKYEIVNSDDMEQQKYYGGDDDAFFYFEMTDILDDGSEKVVTNKNQRKDDFFAGQRNDNRPITPDLLTAAPPPPGIKPDNNGERIVTIYSTADQNDLTGVAAAQPGQAATRDPMTDPVVTPNNTPWDLNTNQKSDASSIELQSAKDEVTKLVSSLLAMTGAPGFVHYDDGQDGGSEVLSSVGIFQQKSSPSSTHSSLVTPIGFTGFDPTQISTDTLSKASRSIRIGRGSVLMDVICEFELRAVGYDGAFGDDESRGGGHYRQVSLVRSFLEGFRRAEVRQLARETVTLLLDRLVQDGIEGLDHTLSIMTRVGDDMNQEVGELNDSLLDYLTDTIRQQERRVEQILDSAKKFQELENFDEDRLENLWTVEDEDGKRVEIFDPKEPKNKIALQDEYENDHKKQSFQLKRPVLPENAQEKLLILLKLLKERVKIEASFSHDEKSQNLRVLAYCLNLSSDELRKELIVKEFGNSLDRLDSFAELVSSSIEYGESTTHQVQPNKVVTLNIPLLERVLLNTKEIIEKQSWKASTGTT